MCHVCWMYCLNCTNAKDKPPTLVVGVIGWQQRQPQTKDTNYKTSGFNHLKCVNIGMELGRFPKNKFNVFRRIIIKCCDVVYVFAVGSLFVF